MTVESTLFAAFDGHRDRRYRSPRRDVPFLINSDRTPNENIRCIVEVTVENSGDIFLRLSGTMPRDADVDSYLSGCPHKVTSPFFADKAVCFRFQPSEAGFLRALSDHIGNVTATGKRYPEPSWKYAAPELAGDLVRLEQELRKHRTR